MTDIERLEGLKSAVDREMRAGHEKGSLACPNCPHDGDWRTEPGGWLFHCEACGARVEAQFPRTRKVN